MKNKTETSLANLKLAIESLREAVTKPSLSKLELAGAIQTFEFCYELSWKTLKKYAEPLGRPIASPREAFRFAHEASLITDEALWLDMIEDRNRTAHTYDQKTALEIYEDVCDRYFTAFEALYAALVKK